MTARQLRAALRRLPLSQRQLALRLRMDVTSVNRWATGKAPIPEAVALLLTTWVKHPHVMPPGRKGPKGSGDRRRAP